MLSHKFRLYLHLIYFYIKILYKSHIFLPALASGFTSPLGNNRWEFPIFFNLGVSLRNIHCHKHLGFNLVFIP